MRRRVFVAVLGLSLSIAARAAAQHPVYVVRHAERADSGAGATMMANDPDLSDVGRARAQSLAAVLKDAGITTILVTEYKRTQQTAEPLAKMIGVQSVIVSAKDPAALVEKVRAASGPVLIVGHSNTIPDVLAKLGVENPPKLADADYDNLFIVIGTDQGPRDPRTGGPTDPAKRTLLRLHFR
jgi:broad specificity phosphatase PhoE